MNRLNKSIDLCLSSIGGSESPSSDRSVLKATFMFRRRHIDTTETETSPSTHRSIRFENQRDYSNKLLLGNVSDFSFPPPIRVGDLTRTMSQKGIVVNTQNHDYGYDTSDSEESSLPISSLHMENDSLTQRDQFCPAYSPKNGPRGGSSCAVAAEGEFYNVNICCYGERDTEVESKPKVPRFDFVSGSSLVKVPTLSVDNNIPGSSTTEASLVALSEPFKCCLQPCRSETSNRLSNRMSLKDPLDSPLSTTTEAQVTFSNLMPIHKDSGKIEDAHVYTDISQGPKLKALTSTPADVISCVAVLRTENRKAQSAPPLPQRMAQVVSAVTFCIRLGRCCRLKTVHRHPLIADSPTGCFWASYVANVSDTEFEKQVTQLYHLLQSYLPSCIPKLVRLREMLTESDAVWPHVVRRFTAMFVILLRTILNVDDASIESSSLYFIESLDELEFTTEPTRDPDGFSKTGCGLVI